MRTEKKQLVRKLLWEYLSDRRKILILYFLTSFLFVFVSVLYQLENLLKLLYAFVLVSFFWICFGIADFLHYMKIRRKIKLAEQNPEQAAAFFPLTDSAANIADKFDFWDGEKEIIGHSHLETAYENLIIAVCRENSTLKSKEETKRNELNDYYLMWGHQIKTPIAAMKLLINDRRDESFVLQEELFKIEQYVEMVLHYLRLESISSDMLLKKYDLHTLVKQAVRKYSVLFINSGLSLRLEDFQETVLTDEKWLCFVLEQLLSNSIKYTKQGNISIYMQPEAKKTLVIEDTGIGICAEDLPRIFERGFTGYNGRIDRKSTGIGLYLCQQVMNQLAHGIKVSSDEGVGTKVYLDLSRTEENK